MIDREKIIRGLHCCSRTDDDNCCNCPYDAMDSDCSALMSMDVLELLKEQEAVEPVLMREGRNEYYNDYVCPECDNELVFGQNFCSECGRQVKWDGRT